jgi:hypothetical protein
VRTKAVPAVLLVAVASMLAIAAPAHGMIHEMVAAYCSGGGHGAIGADGFLEPPGISDFSKQNFAQPVESNGVVAFPLITDAPAAKFPEGSNIFTITPSDSDHPSAQNCKALNP